MKKKVIFLLILAVLLLIAVPASAKSKEPIGEQINLLTGGVPTYTAGQPFHIAHGWAFDPPDERPGPNYSFTLEINGIIANESYRSREKLTWLWVYNFPDGMSAGTHTFTGTWFEPCHVSSEDCEKRNEPVVAKLIEIEVVFTP